MLHFGSIPNTCSLFCSDPPAFEGTSHNLTPLERQSRHRSAAAHPRLLPTPLPAPGQSPLGASPVPFVPLWYHLPGEQQHKGAPPTSASGHPGDPNSSSRGTSASGTPIRIICGIPSYVEPPLLTQLDLNWSPNLPTAECLLSGAR